MSAVDTENTIYHEDPDCKRDFSRVEIRRLRFLLRRLRHLETKIAGKGDSVGGASSDMFMLWEIEALEFVLDEVGFLAPRKEKTT